MTPRRPPTRLPHAFASVCGAALLVLTLVGSAAGQTVGDGSGIRVGISFGGISTIGVSLEFFDDHRSIDVTAGTWSFRDLSVSVVAKQYFGGAAAKPFVGAGLWLVAAFPPDERTGLAAVLTAPVGVDWRVHGRHALGGALNVNRALAVRRTDPEDDLPLNKRLVPLPQVYYRITP